MFDGKCLCHFVHSICVSLTVVAKDISCVQELRITSVLELGSLSLWNSSGYIVRSYGLLGLSHSMSLIILGGYDSDA